MSVINDIKMEYRIGGITQRLIFWNVGLFVLPMVLFSICSLFNIHIPFLRWDIPGTLDWFSLSSNPADLLWKPWSLIGYAFLHAGFLHLLFNMMMLYFAGIVFIASFNLLPMLAGGGDAKMVGASAAIMSILIAAATYTPYYQIRLLLIGTVKLWHVAIVFVLLDLIQASTGNTGGHLAHLAGALFGFGYVKLLQNGTDLTNGVSRVLDFFADLFKPRKSTPFKKVHKNNNPPVKAPVKSTKDITQKQIDDILDKISKSGYDSLTKEEKEFLFKVGK